MRRTIFPALCLFISTVTAQEFLVYQKPPQEILELVDVQMAPPVLLDDQKQYMVLLSRDTYKTIEELSQKELRLGGLRIDPATNIGSRVTYYNNIEIKNITQDDGSMMAVSGLPESPRLANFSWSPDQKKMAFTHTTSEGVEVWVLDLQAAQATRLTGANANANMGDIINWFEDNQSMLVKMVPGERKLLVDMDKAVPTGPTISVADGKKAQNRTYQDLLKNKNDEHNFEQMALSEIFKVSLSGTAEKWLGSAMYLGISFSLDGSYVMVSTFDGDPVSLLKTKNRFSYIQWGDDDVAIAHDNWWNTRNTKTYLFDPSDASQNPVVVSDRNYQDQYSDPGRFVTRRI